MILLVLSFLFPFNSCWGHVRAFHSVMMDVGQAEIPKGGSRSSMDISLLILLFNAIFTRGWPGQISPRPLSGGEAGCTCRAKREEN